MKVPLFMIVAALIIAAKAYAQDTSETVSYHFQFTGIQQAHPPFSAKYTGRNSLLPTAENLLSITSTLYLGSRLWKGGEIYLDPELAGAALRPGLRGSRTARFTAWTIPRPRFSSPGFSCASIFRSAMKWKTPIRTRTRSPVHSRSPG